MYFSKDINIKIPQNVESIFIKNASLSVWNAPFPHPKSLADAHVD